MNLKQKIFTIYDSKTESYHTPIYYPTTNAAIRAFKDAVNDKQTSISQHPEDYILFCLGEYDVLTAEINSHAPQSIAVGSEFKEQPNVINFPKADGKSNL